MMGSEGGGMMGCGGVMSGAMMLFGGVFMLLLVALTVLAIMALVQYLRRE